MDALGEQYESKPKSVKEPDIYIGANIERTQLLNGQSEWSMSTCTYVKSAIKVLEALLIDDES
jgi:hypothetical protein